jgi:hypothetical protein
MDRAVRLALRDKYKGKMGLATTAQNTSRTVMNAEWTKRKWK